MYTYNEPFERDLTGYSVVAHEVLNGKSLYTDVWDHKPPAIYITYAIAQVICGYGNASLYLMTVLSAVLTLIGVYIAASAVRDRQSDGLWAAACWAVVSGDMVLQGNQANVEVFLNTSMMGGLALFLHGRQRGWKWWHTAGIGALFAWATLYKQIAIAPVIFLMGLHLAVPPPSVSSRKKAFLQGLAVGGIITAFWLATFGYFLLRGHFAAFYDCVFTYNRAYSGSLSQALLGLERFDLLVPSYVQNIIPLYAAVGVLLLLMWKKPLVNLVALWLFLAGALIALALPGKFWPHYYQLLVPILCVMAGVAIGELRRFAGRIPRYCSPIFGGLLLTLLLGYQVPQYLVDAQEWSHRKYGGIFISTKNLATELDEMLQPGETFYEFGAETGLYFYARRSPPTSVFFYYPLFVPGFDQRLSELTVKQLDAAPPELIIVNRADMGIKESAANITLPRHPVLDWIAARYTPSPVRPYRGPFLLCVRKGGALEARLLSQTH